MAGAALAVGACASAVPKRAFAEDAQSASAEEGVQYGFWSDSYKCDGCGECVKACREHSGTPEDMDARREVLTLYNQFGDRRYVTTSCMHCAVPSCEQVCPAKAITKRADGIVVVDNDRCIGCKYCYQACPFEVPRYSSKGMEKCDYCIGAGVAVGQAPHCVQACTRKALHFGTVDEIAEMSGRRAQPIDASTGPSCFFS